MKTFNYILARVLRVSLVFLLFFIWIRFYVHNLVYTCLISSVLAFIFDAILIFITKKKDFRANLKRKEILEADGFSNYFVFDGKNVAVDFFEKLFSKNYDVAKRTDYIIFEKDTKKIAFYPYYIYGCFGVQDLINIYNKTKKLNLDKVIVASTTIDENIKKITANLPIPFEVMDKYEVYEKLIKKYDFRPEKIITFEDEQKLNLKGLLKFSLNKKRAKGYIFASVILLISSLFVKITIYYLIMSSVLLLLSIFSFTNSIYNKREPIEEL